MPNLHTTLGELFSDIADAIRDKTGDDGLLIADNFPAAIALIPTGGSTHEDGVVFLDIDGSEVEYWEPSDVSEKTALPTQPTHADLNVRGWTFDLADIQSEDYETEPVYVALDFSKYCKVVFQRGGSFLGQIIAYGTLVSDKFPFGTSAGIRVRIPSTNSSSLSTVNHVYVNGVEQTLSSYSSSQVQVSVPLTKDTTVICYSYSYYNSSSKRTYNYTYVYINYEEDETE